MMEDENWQVLNLEELTEQLKGDPVEYMEFLKTPNLSCGLYSLAAGSKDMQAPHDEDEIYLVLSGKAQFRLKGEVMDVKPGSFLYVRAAVEHSFFEIQEDMTLLVLFSSSARQFG